MRSGDYQFPGAVRGIFLADGFEILDVEQHSLRDLQDFFAGRHYVMKGASWATDRALVRRSFRNWFQPHYPYVFAKLRCVYPE